MANLAWRTIDHNYSHILPSVKRAIPWRVIVQAREGRVLSEAAQPAAPHACNREEGPAACQAEDGISHYAQPADGSRARVPPSGASGRTGVCALPGGIVAASEFPIHLRTTTSIFGASLGPGPRIRGGVTARFAPVSHPSGVKSPEEERHR
jgi:hypothetical protein